MALPVPPADPVNPVRPALDQDELLEYSLLHMPDEAWEEYYYGRPIAASKAENALLYGSQKLRELDQRLFGDAH